MRSYIFFILLVFILLVSSLFADAPFNSNILIEKGIDPDILNNVISSTRQDVAYQMDVKHEIVEEGEKRVFNYYMIVDPYPKYGTELYIQVSKEQITGINKNEITKTLDNLMGVQLYIQHGTLYEKNSLKLISTNASETIIRFTFNKEALPRELKYFSNMTGYIYIANNRLTKIVAESDEPFQLRGINVEHYTKTTFFKPVSTGGYLISAEEISIKGVHDKQDYTESVSGEIVQYWNENHKIISFEKGTTDQQADLKNRDYETISVNLDRYFPILGKEARKAGYDLPKPFGFTLVNMFQDTTMHMTSFKIDGIDYDFNKVLDGDSTYKSLTYAPLIRADVWVLPFVSFSVILGGTQTTTDVKLVSDSGLSRHVDFPPPDGTDITIIKPGSSINLDPFDTNALLYGMGATVAGGLGNYFTTIDFQYMVAYTSEADVSVDMMIITPLIGYTFEDYNTRVFIGAQYQRLAQSLTFKISDESGETVSGVIGLESAEWAGVIGTDYSFTRHWSANLLYSQGVDRKNAVLSIGYRW